MSKSDELLDVARDDAQPPMVGRDRELAQLHERYRAVAGGHGQLVAIQGEPGIGKTRLLQAFRQSLGAGHAAYYECRCSAAHSSTALYPLIELIRRRFQLRDDESESAALEKLHRGFAEVGHSCSGLPLLAALLSNSPLSADPTALTRQRRKLIELFVELFTGNSSSGPVVLAIDDLQWADPSTLELLRALVAQLPKSFTLLALGFRPGTALPWLPEHAFHIALERLDAAHSKRLVDQITQGKRLPASLLDELVAKSNGVPMFVEESTRMLLDSSRLIEHADHYELADATASPVVPSTLQDSLMARLDQLSSAKEVAQLAAILGRTFHYEVIAAIASTDAQLHAELMRLVDAGLLLQGGAPDDEVFSFKHALMQDVAYSSTLKRTRQAMHGEIARRLVDKFPRLVHAEPELIAHHFTEAGMASEAVKYWKLAADQALATFANLEAIHHLQRALQLLASLPKSPERSAFELQLLIGLCPALVATQGYSSSELRRAYDRAHDLCLEVDDPATLWGVLYMLFYYHVVRGENETAAQTARELQRAVSSMENDSVRIEMFIMSGHVFWVGRLKGARMSFEQAVALYDPAVHGGHAAQFGHDPLAVALAYLAWIYAIEGELERSRAAADRAIAHARSIEHPHSLGYALAFAAVSSQLRRDYAHSRALAAEAHAVSVEHSLAHWLADADICHGFADVMEHGTREGMARLQQGLKTWDALGARLWRTHQLGLLAEAYLKLNEPQRALETLIEAQALVEASGESYYEAELTRLEGVARLQLDPNAIDKAADCHRRALRIAIEQGAQLFAERAALVV